MRYCNFLLYPEVGRGYLGNDETENFRLEEGIAGTKHVGFWFPLKWEPDHLKQEFNGKHPVNS